jgi:methylamine dehydrogenase heavy chain
MGCISDGRDKSVLGAWALAALLMGSGGVRADGIETATVRALPPSNGHRLFAEDIPLDHGVDAKVHVIDGDTLKLLANFSNGEFGFFNFSADGKTIYVASRFYARGDHGAHVDVLEFYDTTTLIPRAEMMVPWKRAPVLGYASMMVESIGAKFLFLQNATPGSSVTVIDLAAKKVLSELPTSGCFGIYPSTKLAGRFSTLCGDGTAVTLTVDDKGRELSRQRSAKLFDPEGDALFINGLPDGDKTLFVSFLGTVRAIDFSGEVAQSDTPWAIKDGASGGGWRPGGYQVAALHKAHGVLYVAMHPNGVEGSHKDGAAEIWKVDVATHTVLARMPSASATSLSVTQDEHPLLFAAEGAEIPVVAKYDGDSLKKLDETAPRWQFSGNPLLFVQ